MQNALAKQPTEITAMPTEELKGRLTGLLARTADDLRQMAEIIGELERRGEDLQALKLGIIDHLRRIAAGQLLPEIVVKFSGFPQMLKIAVHLPMEDQRRIIEEEPLELAVWREDKIEFRRVDPLYLTRDQITQVFASDRIRNQTEQVAVLEDRRLRTGSVRRKPKGKVTADRQRGGLVVKRTFVTVAEVIKALADLSDQDEETERDAILVVKITEDEHRNLKQKALDGGTSASELVRRALIAHGLLSKGDR